MKRILAWSGHFSTVNRIVQFKPEDLKFEVAAKARTKLENYPLHEMINVSQGIATMLVWVSQFKNYHIFSQNFIACYHKITRSRNRLVQRNAGSDTWLFFSLKITPVQSDA